MKKSQLIILLLLCSVFMSNGQSYDLFDRYAAYSEQFSPEKLYLHTDREIYCVGDTIWFRGYLRNSSPSSLYPESNYIYVELISPMSEKDPVSGGEILMEAVRKRVKIKRDGNGFSGYIAIPDKLNSGPSTLRAYTWWMRNRSTAQMFMKSIRLMNPVKEDCVSDMITKKDREGDHYMEMGMLNPFHKVRVRAKDIDVQFLPESGRYRPGELSVLGIRVTADSGYGLPVEGELFADDVSCCKFSTDSMGLGRVQVSVPEGTRRVYAVVNHPAALSKRYRVPLPEKDACTIHVDVSADMVEVCASGTSAVEGCELLLCDKSAVLLHAPYESGRRYSIPCGELTPGINAALVIDASGTVFAERDFFVYPVDSVTARVEQEPCSGVHTKSLLHLALNGKKGTPIDGTFSVSVSDAVWFPESGHQHNLESYHWIGGEFESPVENPSMYFDRARSVEERIAGLDVVMLTHGWKYHDGGATQAFSGKHEALAFGREYSQSISGRVTRLLGLDARKADVAFVSRSLGYSFVAKLDSTGRFVLDGLDFPEKTSFLVSTTSDRPFSSVMPVMDEEVFPEVETIRDATTEVIFNSEEERDIFKKAAYPDVYDMGIDQAFVLNPSYITGDDKRKVTGISPLPLFSFKPGQLKLYEEIQSYDTYTIHDYIAMTVPGVRDMGGVLKYKVSMSSSRMNFNIGYAPLIFYLNALQLTSSDRWLLESLTVQDVDAIAVLKGMDAARLQYNTMERSVPVVLIKAKDIPDIPSNVTSTRPLGWQVPTKFYKARYDLPEAQSSSRRMRGTLLWEPCLNTDDGHADFDFWTSDHLVPYDCVIEGYTSDGIPISYKTVLNAQDNQ